MLTSRKYSNQRGKAARIALVVALHIGAATALFGCAKPYRDIKVPEKPVEVTLLETRDPAYLAMCPFYDHASARLPVPAAASHARNGSRHNRSRRKETIFIDDLLPPIVCEPRYVTVPVRPDQRMILL